MVKKYIFCFIILIIMLFSFAGCSGIDGEMKSVSVEKKSSSEIEYLENEIFTIINKFSKNEYEKDNGIDWKDVNKDAQKIGKVLDTVMLDFGEAKVSNDELNNLRNEINNLLIYTTNEDVNNLFKSASNLYSVLPEYYSRFSEDNNKKLVMDLKSLILKSYTSAYFLDWGTAKSNALLAENKYKEMSDNLEYMKENSYNLNKVYILVEEFKNAVDLEELELAKIKYINFIEKYIAYLN